METMFWIWLAAGIVFLIIEVAVPGLIFVCFAAGAFGAAIYAQFDSLDYLVQTAIFAGIAIALIPMTRRLAKKISISGAAKSNVDALIGQPGIVVKDINTLEGIGQVRVQGEVWGASADNDILTGSKVTVLRIEGNRLFVQPGVAPASVNPDEPTGGAKGD
ncbi:MAG: NfeD family protein [Candidatus Zixiibacteriota bacterium]